MKKFALLTAMAVMLGSMAFAEKSIEVGGKIGFGPTVGTKLEGTWAQVGIDEKATCAIDFGLYAHIGLADLGPGTLAIQPELLFTINNGLKGALYGVEGKVKFNSIDIPVLICYDIPVSKISIRPFLGPQIAFPIGNFRYDGILSGTPETKAKGFLFGLTFGCGIAVPVGPVMIGGDVRYNIDFTKVKDEDDNDAGRRGSLMFNFGVAYKF